MLVTSEFNWQASKVSKHRLVHKFELFGCTEIAIVMQGIVYVMLVELGYSYSKHVPKVIFK